MTATQKILRFGVFELNLDAEELRRSGTLIKLAPQPLHLLAILVNHAGQIVTRDEIKEQLWGEETYVDFEQGMNHCIKQIRTVLGDNADNPLYVETLPRRGYRFLAPVVSKNILAPAPKIIKSQSGVQSGVLPTVSAIEAPTEPTAQEASSQGQVATDTDGLLTKGDTAGRKEQAEVAVTLPPTTTEHDDGPTPRPAVTSATAAAEALAPEIARLRKSPDRKRQILLWVGIVVVVVTAAVWYWQTH